MASYQYAVLICLIALALVQVLYGLSCKCKSSTVTTKTTRMTTEATTRVTRPRPKTSHKRIIKPCIEIVSRAKWTASKPSQPCYGICHRIPRVIIHHTDTGRCTDLQTCSTIVKSIQNYHMVTEDFWDIGYNFLVGEDGKVYEGRGWNKQGAHSGAVYNSESLGIAFIGNFDGAIPNDIALDAAKQLIYCGVHWGKVSKTYTLHGHKDVSATTSPGAALYNVIKTWKNFNEKVCGHQAENVISPYIIGGEAANKSVYWPWQAKLDTEGRVCGGSLINHRWILTAAHCIRNYTASYTVPASKLKVRLGEITAPLPAPDRGVFKAIPHRVYVNNETHFTSDVALLQLCEPVSFTDKIRPICLPSSSVDLASFKVCGVSTGYGLTKPKAIGGTLADQLMQAQIDYLTDEECKNIWGSGVQENHHICAGSETKSTCRGDSGGPFACKDSNNKWTVTGVDSFGSTNCTVSVMARVSSYVDDFILETLRDAKPL